MFRHRQPIMSKGRRAHQIGRAGERNQVAEAGDLRDDVQAAMQARRRMHWATVVLIVSLRVCQAMLCYQVPTPCFYTARVGIYVEDGPFSLESVATPFKFPFKEFLPLIFSLDVGFHGSLTHVSLSDAKSFVLPSECLHPFPSIDRSRPQ